MPTAVREQALAAIRLALETQLTGVRVYRNRSSPIVTFPAVNLADGGMKPDDGTLGFTRYDLSFVVRGAIEAADDEALGPALSDLQARIVVALMGNVTLDGTVVDIHEGDTETAFDRPEGRKPVAMIETEFTAVFFTREGDPYIGGP